MFKSLYRKLKNIYYVQKDINNPLFDDINGNKLDYNQRKCILTDNDYTLVVAGAGSGKSLTIIGKVKYLIDIKKIDPSKILCISFTNEATISLRKKLNNDFIDIKTFHKLGLDILKENGYNFKICETNILDIIIEKVFKDLDDKTYKEIIRLNPISKEEFVIINKLKRITKEFVSLYRGNNYDLKYIKKIKKENKLEINNQIKKRNGILLDIIEKILINYTNYLEDNNYLDFDDLINKSIDMVDMGYIKDYEYIIVDEYQDTSCTKYLLLKKIIEKTNSKLMAVGDDFQSIYRFTGCNLDIFLYFKKYFKHAKILKIERTYRNSQELVDVAGKFIMKNKYQIYKKLISSKSNDNPIKIYYSSDMKETFKKIIGNIDGEILVLGRNNSDINTLVDKDIKISKTGQISYLNKEYRYMSVHKSKGLEADNVILINVCNSINGFPNKMHDDVILKYLKGSKEYYPFEEERRLFYVALTRCKNSIYIIAPKERPSIFLKEIEKEKSVKLYKE